MLVSYLFHFTAKSKKKNLIMFMNDKHITCTGFLFKKNTNFHLA